MAKKRRKRRRQLAIEGAHEVRRKTFDGLPIVDAKADFTLIIRTDDVKAAKGSEKDPTNCILAKACAQQVGASIVAFFRHAAYLDLPDAKGKRRVVRYLLDDDAAATVAAFDRRRSVKGEVTVTLKAPPPSQTLDALRKRNRTHRKKKRQSVLKGEVIESNKSQARFSKKPNIRDMDVRNGTGLVHNVVKKSK